MKFKTLFLVLAALAALGSANSPAWAEDAKTLTNSLGMEFVLIPVGSFMMGSDRNFEEANDDETPRHRVTINRPFYLGKYEVTQEQWEAVMGSNPSEFKGRSNPVESVSWDDAQEFIQALNAKEGTKKYRLPTEAEWEYAARAGTSGAYSFGDEADNLGIYAWCGNNSGEKPHPVGQKRPNPWGLYDMHGNVWEWVQDWYEEKYYASSPETDPKGPTGGSSRVIRGGCWFYPARTCRSGFRAGSRPGYRDLGVGFRLALSLGQ